MAIKVPKNIFIGSKNRLLFPVHKYIYGATLFIEPQEHEQYSKLYDNTFNIVTLEDDNKGFGFLCNQMLNYANKNDIKTYFFCDDDIFGFKFREKKTNLNTELMRMEILLKDNNFSQLMMSFSGHNWFYKKNIKKKIGAWCFVLNKVKDLLEVGGYDESLSIYNDWDMSAKLIRDGKETACYYNAMFEHKMKSQKGGAEIIYKKQGLMDVAKNILIEKYGDKCLREVIAHNQKEIRFNWNKL